MAFRRDSRGVTFGVAEQASSEVRLRWTVKLPKTHDPGEKGAVVLNEHQVYLQAS